MKDRITNVLLVGVGGQGILLASEILSETAMLAGYEVKKSEIHGMSQRGGSVVSHVRFGKQVFSPIVPEGEGDILFGFELMETCRCLPLLRQGAVVIANNLRILPPAVLMGQEKYPENLDVHMQSLFPEFTLIDCQKVAEESGNIRTANIVMLGAVSRRLDIAESFWLKAVEKMVPSKAVEVNLKAFLKGRSL
ncbi:MAG TPA: indolepyruvate oxidoreductase subunit beta [Deltaproteobacteria bacterium]|nr:indolepyruvate oxidoreductase subunit beta [Deltaproteobacteria bacterium]HQB39189.1 indolepyruvate oxidoreductase subunit beta [Deltaproteobacteria bacterium]